MYEILTKLKTRLPQKSWVKMVEQAKEREKITEEEYQILTKETEE